MKSATAPSDTDSSKQVRLVDVLVVGGGISGLCAVDEIQRHMQQLHKQQPLSVLLLEANARVGGRCYCDEQGCDLGGAYFGPLQDRVLSVIDALGLKLKKVNTEQKTVSFVNNKIKPFDGVIPPLNPLALLDVNTMMVEMDRIAETIDIVHPEHAPDAEILDNMTCAQMMDKFCWTQTAKNLMTTGLRAVTCKEPHEVSALAWCWYIRSSGNIKRILETKDGAQDSNVVGGAGQIPKLLAKKVTKAGCEILLSQPVRTIASNPAALDGRCIIVETETLRISAKALILAIPPNQQAKIRWCEQTARLSPIRRQALENASFGSIIKTFTFYPKPFWREHSLNGSIVADSGIALVCIESVQGTPEAPQYAIMAFILSTEAVKRSLDTKEQRRDALCRHFKRLFGDDERLLSPVDYKEHNWATEPFVGGCYVALPAVGAIVKFQPEWMRSQLIADASAGSPCGDRIFIAGTETARRFSGYMDGAVEAGIRSGRNALVALGLLDRATHFDTVSDPAPSKQMPFVEMGLSNAEKRWIPSVGQLLAGLGVTLTAVVLLWLAYFNKQGRLVEL